MNNFQFHTFTVGKVYIQFLMSILMCSSIFFFAVPINFLRFFKTYSILVFWTTQKQSQLIMPLSIAGCPEIKLKIHSFNSSKQLLGYIMHLINWAANMGIKMPVPLDGSFSYHNEDKQITKIRSSFHSSLLFPMVNLTNNGSQSTSFDQKNWTNNEEFCTSWSLPMSLMRFPVPQSTPNLTLPSVYIVVVQHLHLIHQLLYDQLVQLSQPAEAIARDVLHELSYYLILVKFVSISVDLLCNCNLIKKAPGIAKRKNKFGSVKHVAMLYLIFFMRAVGLPCHQNGLPLFHISKCKRKISTQQTWQICRQARGRVAAGVANLPRRKKTFRGYLVGLPSFIFFCHISHCSNIVNFTIEVVGSLVPKLNQMIKTCLKFCLPIDAEWCLQGFFPQSQSDQNITKEYQGHKMMTIADMSYYHFWTTHKS
ncbi:hypothetical protein VP01_2771g1 [Puccinia sorghi]|uniref:Uncharacterized protein n=1 Tax=Puccinia sorghi TaxID=27349 RepID=A0A0L6V2U2_9BASI|nr:hypothetical protein VP01_2771g1 [Puccinia sorghi]